MERNSNTLTVYISIALLLSGIASFGQPKIKFEKLSYDFGEIEQNSYLRKEISFTNVGDKPLVIDQVLTTDDSGVADRPHEPVMPGKSGIIYYRRETSHCGPFRKTITVRTNDPLQETLAIKVEGKICAP